MGAIPEVAGLNVRAIGTDDAQAWAELLATSEKADQEGMSFSSADLLDELNAPHLDPALDTVGVWDGPRMVAYVKVHADNSVTDVARVNGEGTVHPDWRRRGLGTALMPWLIERAGEHARGYRDVPREVNNSAISTNVGADALLRKFGFEPCRYFFDMKRSLREAVPETTPAAGLSLVRFDESVDEALRNTHNDVFIDHWGSPPVDAAVWKAWFTGHRAFRAESSYLVMDGDTIAAYTLGYEWQADTDATGVRELYVGQVGTRRSYRRRGLARMALTTVLATAAQAGYERAGLEVDADNPTGALGLYERLGFSVRSRRVTYRLAL